MSSQTASFSLLAPVLVSGVACNPTSLGQSTVSTCTLTLTQAAPAAGGSSVTLASNNTSLNVPVSVDGIGGSHHRDLQRNRGGFDCEQPTRDRNGDPRRQLSDGGIQSARAGSRLGRGLQTLTSLVQSAVSTCTLTLAQSAPAGGSSVTLASNNTLLAVPTSVTVAAGGTTATFSATAAAIIASNQSATVTTTFGGNSDGGVQSARAGSSLARGLQSGGFGAGWF